jgi:hypothetical protein
MSGSNDSHLGAEFWERRLSNWLFEWNLRNDMLKGEPLTDSVADSGEKLNAASLVNYSDDPIQVGDIRILRSRLIGETDLPVYVAVISEWEDGDWLIAPYGEFSEPATTGEFLTCRGDFGLRVLCLWNTHSISSEDLSFSFLEDRMTDEERLDSWEVFRAVSTGDDLPERLRSRIGPPIVDAQDPRIAYQEEFKELMSPIRECWTFPQIFESPIEFLEEPVEEPVKFEDELVAFEQPAYELAAATPEDFVQDEPRFYPVENTSLEICLKKHPKGLSLQIFVKETGELAERISGVKIKDQKLNSIAELKDGVCVIGKEVLKTTEYFEFKLDGERVRIGQSKK